MVMRDSVLVTLRQCEMVAAACRFEATTRFLPPASGATPPRILLMLVMLVTFVTFTTLNPRPRPHHGWNASQGPTGSHPRRPQPPPNPTPKPNPPPPQPQPKKLT